MTGSSFIIAVYGDYLAQQGQGVTCGNTAFTPGDLLAHSKRQVNPPNPLLTELNIAAIVVYAGSRVFLITILSEASDPKI